ncbi:hypothetical protein TSUD_12610 [Trifolium subterraneum]|uniref:Uncharacterized protein n=1 Tax=Trifolium subterraneum TaxID=3900 RepID=A0A2Z6P595_TRISU|nr:hypothetical protein TSUD_12610 [Trifolium subterraneum]
MCLLKCPTLFDFLKKAPTVALIATTIVKRLSVVSLAVSESLGGSTARPPWAGSDSVSVSMTD